MPESTLKLTLKCTKLALEFINPVFSFICYSTLVGETVEQASFYDGHLKCNKIYVLHEHCVQSSMQHGYLCLLSTVFTDTLTHHSQDAYSVHPCAFAVCSAVRSSDTPDARPLGFSISLCSNLYRHSEEKNRDGLWTSRQHHDPETSCCCNVRLRLASPTTPATRTGR